MLTFTQPRSQLAPGSLARCHPPPLAEHAPVGTAQLALLPAARRPPITLRSPLLTPRQRSRRRPSPAAAAVHPLAPPRHVPQLPPQPPPSWAIACAARGRPSPPSPPPLPGPPPSPSYPSPDPPHSPSPPCVQRGRCAPSAPPLLAPVTRRHRGPPSLCAFLPPARRRGWRALRTSPTPLDPAPQRLPLLLDASRRPAPPQAWCAPSASRSSRLVAPVTRCPLAPLPPIASCPPLPLRAWRGRPVPQVCRATPLPTRRLPPLRAAAHQSLRRRAEPDRPLLPPRSVGVRPFPPPREWCGSSTPSARPPRAPATPPTAAPLLHRAFRQLPSCPPRCRPPASAHVPARL